MKDICILKHPYVLTAYPHGAELLADKIVHEPLDQRSTYVLLDGILSTADFLINNGLQHGNITPSNILVADLSPEDPYFWLVGFSSMKPISEDTTKSDKYIDVTMAMWMITHIRGGSTYFEDPAADAIFTGFCRLSSPGLHPQGRY